MGTKATFSWPDAFIAIVFGGYTTALTAYALYLGYDGVILTTTLSGLTMVFGFFFGKSYISKRLSLP